MRTIFWKKNDSTTLALEKVSFTSEAKFEKYIISNSELLPDLFIGGSQVRTHEGIPDIIGIDNDNNIVIIEMKNVEVDEKIIPQVLRYAIWAESNPDSIKSWWLELDEKPDEIEISWSEIEVRILIIAPKIKNTVLNYVNKIQYPVDLVEINKYVIENEEFILIEKLEAEKERKIRVTTTKPEYNREFYKKHHNDKSVPKFYETSEKIDILLKEQKWNLEKKFNKNYVGYKHGFNNVFGVKWTGSKSFGIFFKVSEASANEIKVEGLEPYRYEKPWKQVLYLVDTEDFPVQRLLPVFQEAYKNIVG